jgi:exopolysaccharide biosynthesis polyprenyl glycosylphosphotransferase
MIAGLVCQAVFYYNELYNLQLIRLPYASLSGVLRAFAALFFLLAIASFALPHLAPVLSRVLWFALFLGPVAIIARIVALPRRRERVLVIGTGDQAADLQETVFSYPEWNMEIVEIATSPAGVAPWLNDPKARNMFDRVIVADARCQSATELEVMLRWKMAGLPIEEAQNFFERATGQVRVDGLTVGQCIFSTNFNNGASKRKIKRAFDLFAATTLLLLALPIMLIVGFVIWCQRDGPILFLQTRHGLYGKPFKIYKFRTMTSAPTSQQARWAGQESHRITRLGAFLRKYRLDELPQLFNILRGDMSLVGPRPEQPSLCSMLEEQIPFFEQRHSVPPGLTGWAQVKYGYGSSIAESKRKLEFDLFYVKHLSLWLDCAILIETVKVVVVGRGAL